MSERGRLTIGFNHESYYDGPEAPSPFNFEGCVNDKGELLIFKSNPDGSFIKLNPVGDLRNIINNLDQSGVFANAEAFITNRKIYRMYFDQLRGTVRLDPELRFEPLYRYYAIREIQPDQHGAYIYVTGVEEVDGEGNTVIVSNLVDFNIVESQSGDGSLVSVPQVGGLIRQMIDGKNYIVEMFDSDRMLVNRISFQAIAVRATDLDLSPDMAITDIIVTTNRAITGIDNACFLYRGESVNALEITVYLKYADGRIRNVTHEQIEGGRLSITGLDEISTDSITPPGETPNQNFVVSYQMIRTNTSLPDDPQTTSSGSLIDPASLTISKNIDVYIKEDIYADINSVIVAGYINEPIPGTKKINLKYFGHYSTGVVHDITNIVEYVSAPPITGDAGIGVTQSIIIRVPYGNAGLYKQFSFTLLAPTNKKYCIIRGENARFILYNSNENAGGTHSGRFTGFRIFNESTQVFDTVTFNTLLNSMQFEVAGNVMVPNYIRIRDVEHSTYLYTTYINDPNSIFYDEIVGKSMYTDRPLLIEFLKVTIEGGIAVNAFVTGALVHYARSAL